MVKASDSSLIQLPAGPLPGNNSGQVAHTRASVHQAVKFDTDDQMVVTLNGHRSGTTLAMRHRLSDLST